MAKLLSGKTVITLQNDSWGTTVFEAPYVSISSLDKGKTYNIVTETAKQSSESCAKIDGYSKEPELSPHDKLVARHAQVITDVLQDAETARLTSALKRETLEAEIAAQERADKISLTFAVHNAIQAGLDMEEVTASMRDDHAGYVSDMADQVYLDTDLDTLVNVS